MTELGARVDPHAPDGAAQFGDEPWMLSCRTHVPVYVGRDRVRQLRQIEKDGATKTVILDDGFQHLAVARDYDLIVINVLKSVEEAYCLPWGELREPLSAVAFASAVVLVGNDEAGAARWEALIRSVAPKTRIFRAKVATTGWWDRNGPVTEARLGKWGAFCGIATPASFIRQLDRSTVFLKAYPDHHRYGAKDFDWLEKQRVARGLEGYVTTDKDLFKVAAAMEARGQRVCSLRISYEIPDELWYFLEKSPE
jgi:tetraacyldisaccharide 4'-kinase